MIKANIDLSVVVPVYNSAEIINELVRRMEMAIGRSGLTYEFILTDDCSTDNSWQLIEAICHSKKCVKGVRLSSNKGQWYASLAGMSTARGNNIVTIDDDLEQDPSDILKLYQVAVSGNYKVVFGMGEAKYKVKGKNQFISYGLNHVLNFFWQKPPTDSFKILKREVVFDDKDFLPRIHFEAYIRHKLSRHSIGYCEVAYFKRFAGLSNHPFIKKLNLFFLFTSQYYLSIPKASLTFSIAEILNES